MILMDMPFFMTWFKRGNGITLFVMVMQDRRATTYPSE